MQYWQCTVNFGALTLRKPQHGLVHHADLQPRSHFSVALNDGAKRDAEAMRRLATTDYINFGIGTDHRGVDDLPACPARPGTPQHAGRHLAVQRQPGSPRDLFLCVSVPSGRTTSAPAMSIR
jgi:hypothetical protein